MILAVFLLMGVSSTCNYSTGFELGISNFKNSGQGYNLDRFCSSSTDAEKILYKKGVDDGFSSGKTFEELSITKIPESEADLAQMVSVAKQIKREAEIQAMQTDLERLKKESNSQKQNVQELKQQISAQENKIKQLKDAAAAEKAAGAVKK